MLNAIANVVTLVSQAGLQMALAGRKHLPAVYPIVRACIEPGLGHADCIIFPCGPKFASIAWTLYPLGCVRIAMHQ